MKYKQYRQHLLINPRQVSSKPVMVASSFEPDNGNEVFGAFYGGVALAFIISILIFCV